VSRVANAGAMARPRSLSADGYESRVSACLLNDVSRVKP
jgi:hypothetical protein